jgi:anti-sigma regulatory factor (Ser/Thr protein kinase)
VDVEVCTNEDTVSVLVTDRGGDKVIPEAAVPDIEAKLAGEQTPRGWGLFLIEQMVDEVKTTSADGMHTVELVMNREGAL